MKHNPRVRTGWQIQGIINRVVIGRGDTRLVANLLPGKDAQREAGIHLKRFLFSDNGAYHKAKRRGERALAGLPPRTRALSF